jgi:phosphohistidine phosphatase
MIITFLRHAHADPSRDDKSRVLSTKGIGQTLNYSKLINDINYDLVIHSSAIRTKETADIIFYNKSAAISYIEIPSLYLPESETDISEVSKTIMLYPYATPNDILNKDKSGAWERYSKKAYHDVMEAVSRFQGKRVLIIAHGTITNIIGYKFSRELESIKYRYLGYLEGFSLKLSS